ncbi:hypothetical protein DPMN_129711 [Dreissena polymorpha]|uniref:Uncharacterized protein n=1 Tax=Dreissena polymorpha TaxID=45954 RepID=A0A9D4H1N5_DREPO|nr:hypothetical protein DPMN_129711 [Dreissena polymorpha]
MSKLFIMTVQTVFLFCGVHAYFDLDFRGCHVYESTGMSGWCPGGCWPFYSNEHEPAGHCEPCPPCQDGRKMDELCRCTYECPVGKFGIDCTRDCPYRCRACDRQNGACTLWCSHLCLDTCQLSTGICHYNFTQNDECFNELSINGSTCPEYSHYFC